MEQNSEMLYVGGDPPNDDRVQGWVKTVRNDLAPTTYKLYPLWDLFDNL